MFILVVAMTMTAAPRMVILLLLTLHIHHTKYFLVEVDTGDKPGRVSSNSNKALDAAPDNTTGLTIIFTYYRDINHVPEQKTIEILNDCS